MENIVGEDKLSSSFYMSVGELNLNNESRCVVVRLLRTWEARNFKRNKELMSVDFLLLDEKDCLIQGSIHHLLLHIFKDKLKEGQIFLIRNFDVLRSGIQYRLTDHPYMIRFTNSTIMEEVDEDNYVIRPEKFRLHNHNELLHLVNKYNDLPDMIGFLCKFDTPRVYGDKKAKRAVLHIYLEEGKKIRLTNWDSLADSVEALLSEINESTIVIVATSVLPKTFLGELCLNGSSSTKIYLNNDFEAISEFRERMKIQPQFDHSYKNGGNNNANTQLHSISEILDFISIEKKQVKEFTCKGKITEVVLNNGWSYISCSNCSRKMEKIETTLSCNNCNNSHAVGVLRFRIEVVVEDGSGTTTFVIFDKEARKLTKTTAPALMTEREECVEVDTDKDGRHQAPTSILNIVGKMHKFQIKVTPYNFRAKHQSFTVSCILDDISNSEKDEAKEKYKVATGETHESKITRKIKIEEKEAVKEPEIHDKGTMKRRRLQKNGKKASQQDLEDGENSLGCVGKTNS